MRPFVFVLLCLLLPSAMAAELRDLRVWDGPESTRVIFDLSAATGHKVFTLSNPDRVVIDIEDVRGGGMLISRATPKGVVRQLRSGPRGGALRVVLETSEAVVPKSFLTPPAGQNGNRLIVELYGRTPTLEELAGAKLAPRIEFAEKPIVIAVDAGHGGEDPGAIGRSGLQEKDASLAMARRLANLINQQPNMKAVLTRDGDYFIGLRERTVKARQAKADMFVSIHCNAVGNRAIRGSAVYVLSDRGATNEQARWLAHKENSADLVGGIALNEKDNELAAVLIDLSQASSMEASFDVGGRVLKALNGNIGRLQKTEVQQAGFMVLKSPDMPSLLVETAFITNADDEKLLGDARFHNQIAESVLDGIQGYFKSYRPHQMPPEDKPRLQKVRGKNAKVAQAGLGAD